MTDIEGIKQRILNARQYVLAMNEVRALAYDTESLLSEVDRLRIERTDVDERLTTMTHNWMAAQTRCDNAKEDTRRAHQESAVHCNRIAELKNKEAALESELDELRTRHSRLVDSTDTFVAALVDERFKKDHAAMLAELHTLRTKDIDESKKVRLSIDAMPTQAREVFEQARTNAKMRGVSILRTLVDMVVESRDECRQHLARINMLESEKRILDEAADVLDKSNAPAGLLVERIEWLANRVIKLESEKAELAARPRTMPVNASSASDVSKVETASENVTAGNNREDATVPDDVLQRAANYANKSHGVISTRIDVSLARDALKGLPHRWYGSVREFVKLWREGQAPDVPHPLGGQF